MKTMMRAAVAVCMMTFGAPQADAQTQGSVQIVGAVQVQPAAAIPTAAPAPLAIVSPAGGETFKFGSTIQIKWTGGNPAWPMLVSIIDMAKWQVAEIIASNAPNTGSVSWTVDLPPGLYEFYVQGDRDQPDSNWTYGNTFTLAAAPAPAPVPPPSTVAILSPANGAAVAGWATITATATGRIGSVAYTLDGSGYLDAVLITPPYTFYWDTSKFPNGTHTLTAGGWDKTTGQWVAGSSPITVTINNPVPAPAIPVPAPTPDPGATTVRILAPAYGASVSGSITLTAAVTGNIGAIAYTLDGSGYLTSALVTSPYTFVWDTTKVVPGTHTLTAGGWDKTTGGYLVTSAPIVLSVGKPAPPPLVITAPTSADSWPTGSLQAVRWTGGDPSWPMLVQILDMTKHQVSKTLADNAPNNGRLDMRVELPPGRYQIYLQGDRGQADSQWAYGAAFAVVTHADEQKSPAAPVATVDNSGKAADNRPGAAKTAAAEVDKADSPAFKAVLAPVAVTAKDVAGYCSTEISLLCQKLKDQALAQCLKGHRDDATSQCRDAMDGKAQAAPPANQTKGLTLVPASKSSADDKGDTKAAAPAVAAPEEKAATKKDECGESVPPVGVISKAEKPVLLNFDEVDALQGDIPAKCYLRKHGIFEEPGTTAGCMFVINNASRDYYPGKVLVAPSGPNVLTQATPNNGPETNVMRFQEAYGCVRFTRPEVLAGRTGIIYPEWTVTAYDMYGRAVASASEPVQASYQPIPARTFTLKGGMAGIASLKVYANGHVYAAFLTLHMDDLQLLPSCQ